MKISFDEAKKRYPIGQRVGAFGDKVPKEAHEDINKMSQWLDMYIASFSGCTIVDNMLIFQEYE